MSAKSIIRQEAKARRAALDEAYRTEATKEIVDRTAALIQVAITSYLKDEPGTDRLFTIATYAPIDDEVDLSALYTHPLLATYNIEYVVPICLPEGRMEFILTGAEDLQSPREKQPRYLTQPFLVYSEDLLDGRHLYEPEEIDIMLVPGLAFDEHHFRIGYGAGYYDRYFARYEANGTATHSIGICFATQRVENAFPNQFDQQVSWVVDEDNISLLNRLGINFEER